MATSLSTEQLMFRNALSARAWEKARWVDGRNVIIGGVNEDRAWAQQAVSTHAEDHRHMHTLREYLSWEAVAMRLLQPLPLFGPPNGKAPEGFAEEPCELEDDDE